LNLETSTRRAALILKVKRAVIDAANPLLKKIISFENILMNLSRKKKFKNIKCARGDERIRLAIGIESV
jgi:hypothetical protein